MRSCEPYRIFMSSGRLCAENLSIAKAILSRGIVHAMERGERDESRLAMYAVNTFNTYSDGIIAFCSDGPPNPRPVSQHETPSQRRVLNEHSIRAIEYHALGKAVRHR